MIRAGYIQLVQEDLKPIGDRVACLMDYRPDWNATGPSSDIAADLYFRERTITLASNYKTAKMGLFNTNYELVLVMWPHLYVHGNILGSSGNYTIINQHYDPIRGLWTTHNTKDLIDDIYHGIINGLE